MIKHVLKLLESGTVCVSVLHAFVSAEQREDFDTELERDEQAALRSPGHLLLWLKGQQGVHVSGCQVSRPGVVPPPQGIPGEALNRLGGALGGELRQQLHKLRMDPDNAHGAGDGAGGEDYPAAHPWDATVLPKPREQGTSWSPVRAEQPLVGDPDEEVRQLFQEQPVFRARAHALRALQERLRLGEKKTRALLDRANGRVFNTWKHPHRRVHGVAVLVLVSTALSIQQRQALWTELEAEKDPQRTG